MRNLLCAKMSSDRVCFNSDIGLIHVPTSIIIRGIICCQDALRCLLDFRFHRLMFRSLLGKTIVLPKTRFPKYCHILYQTLHRRTIMAEALPPLSREDRDTYARMGTTMEWYHQNFRNTWKVLYAACSSGKRPANMSIRQFLNTGSEFAHHLTMHHTIGMSTFSGLMKFCTIAKYACRRTAHLSRTCAENARI